MLRISLVTTEYYGSVMIECNGSVNNHVGIAFSNSSDIYFNNLIFRKCGGKFNTTVIYTAEDLAIVPPIFTTFYFKETQNIYFNQVDILSSHGYGIVMYACSGTVEFNKFCISNGSSIPFSLGNGTSVDGYSSGGGVYMEYMDDSESSSNNTISFNKCNFKYNMAERFKSIIDMDNGNFVPFGRGAGISIVFRGNAILNNVYIINSVFSSNKALWGAGLYIENKDGVSKNHFLISNTVFSDNVAKMAGDGVRIISYLQRNEFVFINCSFKGNKAEIGGAVSEIQSLWSPHLPVPVKHNTMFLFCEFSFNCAYLGSALYLNQVSLLVFNLTMNDNYFIDRKKNATGVGALVSYKSTLLFGGSSTIFKNIGTALLLDSTKMIVNGSVNFTSNTGVNGGAVALYEYSTLTLGRKANLSFFYNTASKGGAIYVQVSGPTLRLWKTTELKQYQCFFQFYDNNPVSKFKGNVEFVSNRAKYVGSGEAIFVTTLQDCQQIGEENLVNVITGWKNFDFSNQLSPINTDVANITHQRSEWNVFPGQLFTPSITLYDERGNTISATVIVDVVSKDNKVKLSNQNTRFVVVNNKIELELIGERDLQFDVIISTMTGKGNPLYINYLKLTACKFGYLFNKEMKTCTCNKKDRDIALCVEGKVYLFNGRWAKPKQETEISESETVQVCPESYCRESCSDNHTLNGNDCLYQPFNQCAQGRSQTSFLCGKCEGNLSVAFGSEQCMDCSGKGLWWLWIVLVITISITLAILGIMYS